MTNITTHPEESKINHKLMAELQVALTPFPEALSFAIGYKKYIHALDDLIDSPNRPTSEEILAVAALASAVFSLPFWIENHAELLLVEQLINNTYADSVLWESSEIAYKKTSADTLRHAGLDMFFAVILIKLGRNKLREFSPQFRTQCHELQGAE